MEEWNGGMIIVPRLRLTGVKLRRIFRFCPGGTAEISPVIHCWVKEPKSFSLIGTTERQSITHHFFSRPYGT